VRSSNWQKMSLAQPHQEEEASPCWQMDAYTTRLESICLIFFFFVVLGFEPRACTLSSFMFFRDRVLRTICSVCLQTEILLISARITGISHQ
jgi:hypothetical protein